ncbi:MAG: hypothetical protein BGP06_17045 [Rhizobiales bacterium 65-9]|nr:hypothetical protein [Hyphomicrobiales bacterium]OJY38138.1 MAG: hypothetical protein BGP06_17045 [Rhizobiales bacterium 65-9]
MASGAPAIIGAILIYLFLSPFMAPATGQDYSTADLADFLKSQTLTVAASLQFLIMLVVITQLPAALLVKMGHLALRASDRTSMSDYMLTGFAIGVATAIVSYIFPIIGAFGIYAPVAGPVAMGLYRRFAGLEPKPLPEAIIVNRPETLVPADHPHRRRHMVIRG